MEMLFGLPAHPLLTHFPVVGIPLVSIAAIVLVVRPSTIARSGVLIAGFSVLTALSTIFAATSGEALAELLSSGENIAKHRALGEALRGFAIFQTVSIIAFVSAGNRENTPAKLQAALSAVVVIASVLALIWVVRTGHEGASQSWGFLS